MKKAHSLRFAFAAALMAMTVAQAHATQSPFGIATPDSSGSYFGGPLAPLFAWVAVHQAHFYRALTAALSSLRANPAGIWLLFGLSFAYGVFHAVGPGHGKAVITSYMLASGDTARRGIALSFVSAAVQAVSAVIVVAIGAIILRVSATAMTFATDWIEIISYGAIALFGAWLLWSKIRGDHHHHHHHVGAHNHDHDHDHGHNGLVCVPTKRSQSLLTRGWQAILAVGIRPCSGAIIILVFALSQGLFLTGVAATFVMALGTGLTVATLAIFAVSAKGAAVRIAGSGSTIAIWFGRAIEIGGAAAVLLMGLVLLGGALSTGLPGS